VAEHVRQQLARLPGLSQRAAPYSMTDIVLALLLFYLPLAHFTPPRLFRTSLLQVPTWGSGNETGWSITPFLVPETLLIFVVGAGVLAARRGSLWRPNSSISPLRWASGLMLAGSTVSLIVSQYPGISIGGLAGRCTVFALAVVMALSAPSPQAVKLWTYAVIAGTSLMCAAGLYYFYQAFGLPTSLSNLPIYRVSPSIRNYQLATYGFASNTVDLLVVTAPLTVALVVARSSGWLARILLGVAAALMYANLLVSFERWAWVCLAIAVLLTVLFYRRQRRALVIAGAVLLAVAIGGATIAAQLGDYFQQALDPSSGSNTIDRLRDWGEGLAVLIANPAGVGLGTVGTLPALTQTSSHNLFIDIGIEGGLLALVGSIVWTIHHVDQALRVILRADAEDELAFGLLLGALMFVVYGLFFSSLLYFSGLMVWLAVWWCFPVMASAVRGSASSSASTARPLRPRNDARTALGRGSMPVGSGPDR